ncbi:uncharacterized protein BT62DRAFT_928177 [Guyanagaster necrorhizus]|uniref:Yeast cell wall synthesis Kre9/Knh1-like N-terminal domain-containing protein n=1 Tax=Guyanagaster necrorhizus TaxID=856835 RepID=A0A9P8AWP5_9AGAR|nr:uncharacterized protein BT62DRAFT_928177 [Guyanagaster necrorhizus MCA 3950]KAG7450889.1 hypothetical protein BT62DRAFT_928177 [Guyanagaster necrorhizus MCA 3950]
MKFSSFAAATVLSSVLALVNAAVLDVFVPQITSPTAGDTWVVGSNYTVTWDTSDAPAQITNEQGEIYLRKGSKTQSPALASGFSILDGAVNVIVPETTTVGDDYYVVLFGDSGNWSGEFSIKA